MLKIRVLLYVMYKIYTICCLVHVGSMQFNSRKPYVEYINYILKFLVFMSISFYILYRKRKINVTLKRLLCNYSLVQQKPAPG